MKEKSPLYVGDMALMPFKILTHFVFSQKHNLAVKYVSRCDTK